jgi:glycosyltransferase involved in cell wall biosynthesis
MRGSKSHSIRSEVRGGLSLRTSRWPVHREPGWLTDGSCYHRLFASEGRDAQPQESMIKVLFDTQIFRAQRVGGISRYFVELIQGLPAFEVKPQLWMPRVDNEHAISAGLSLGGWSGPGTARRILRRALNMTFRCSDDVRAALGTCDILHRTFYGAPKPFRRRSVCTVVDMIPELFPELFPQGNPHLKKQRVVEASDLVFTISHCTSRDLVALYGCDPGKVVTTHLGIDLDHFSKADAPAGQFQKPYILFVGGRGGYKNFNRFAQASVAVMATQPNLSLAIVGGGALTDEEKLLFSKDGVAARVWQANIADSALPTIYHEAEAFIFPSEYEGFGLPLLEAFASGCPVAASNTSCFPEIGGTAVEYFNPKSVDEMAHAIDRILRSPARADELRALGRERAGLFAWKRTAELTAAAYRTLV